MGNELDKETIAAYKFVDSMVPQCDGTNTGAYFWYGWALREAFLAGIKYSTMEWIDVKNRLPTENRRVLVYDSLHKEVTIGEAPIGDDGFWSIVESLNSYSRDVSNVSGEITHWMPLPEPPKE